MVASAGGRLIEHGVTELAPETLSKVGVTPVGTQEFGDVSSSRLKTEVGCIVHFKITNETINASRAGIINVHRIGAAIVGLANNEIKTLGEGELTFVAVLDDDVVFVFGANGNLTISIISKK